MPGQLLDGSCAALPLVTLVGEIRGDQGSQVACEKAGVSRSVVYDAREQDDAFRRAWDQSLENGLDHLEAQLHRRGRKNSDKAAMFLLAHRRPEVFGHTTQDANRTMRTDDVMILFQNLVRAVRVRIRLGSGAAPHLIGIHQR